MDKSRKNEQKEEFLPSLQQLKKKDVKDTKTGQHGQNVLLSETLVDYLFTSLTTSTKCTSLAAYLSSHHVLPQVFEPKCMAQQPEILLQFAFRP